MSRRLLANAILAQLRDTDANGGLGLTRRDSGLTPIGGMPPAMMGERYVGVRIGSRTTGRVTHGLEEHYSAIVTVSYRINGRVPFDRLGPDLMEAASFGFDDLVDAVRRCIHLDHYDGRVIRRANNAMPDTMAPFTTGLEFLGDEDPVPVDGSWFGADGDRHCGIVQNLRFGKCSRCQNIESLEGVT